MSTKNFTESEIEELRNNPYTYKVTEKSLSITKEFKEIILEELKHGKTIRTILRENGYNDKILGNSRIAGIRSNLLAKKEITVRIGNSEDTEIKISKTNAGVNISTKDYNNLVSRVEYCEQILTFLKKIVQISK